MPFCIIQHPWNGLYYAVLVGDGGEIEAADGPLSEDQAKMIAGNEEEMRYRIQSEGKDSRELGATLQWQLKRHSMAVEQIIVPVPKEE